MRARPPLVGALVVGLWGVVVGLLLSPGPPIPPTAPVLYVERVTVVGEDFTAGEATAWPAAPKLAGSAADGLHAVYQLRRGRSGDRWVYARTEGGSPLWEREEHLGRRPTVAVDGRGTVYVAFIERTEEEDLLWLWARPRSSPSDGWVRRIVERGPRGSLGQPALAAGPQALYLVWERHSEGDHRIEHARLPLLGSQDPEDWRRSPPATETLAANPLGAYFPTIVVDAQGRVVVAWEAAEGPIVHRIDAAVYSPREADAGWTLMPGISGDVGDARHAALGLEARGGRVRLVFVTRGPGFRSALYTTTFSSRAGRWKAPFPLLHRGPTGSYDPTQQELLAFPAAWGGLLLWGHTVPAACGTGPLYGRFLSGGTGDAEALLGEFASYPHVREDPQEPGLFHVLWTDRNVEELRAFEVRYARVRLRRD